MTTLDDFEAYREVLGDLFIAARRVPDRGVCVVQRFMVTCGLHVDMTIDGQTYENAQRYCYHSASEAIEALRTWGGKGDPPGDWIREKVSGRFGPGARRPR
jgi:hypothetical protein